MQKSIILLISIALAITVANAEIHAVLVAGSNGFSNYRHQSDVCHAYHILLNNGVQAENIIVMAYNDIAHNVKNPFPGTMFNKPSEQGQESENVYAGCVIDYEGDDVTPDNYLAVITGNADAVKDAGNGRVLSSGPNDMVFLNFVDHGNAGLVGFPDINTGGLFPKQQFLYADQLNEALKTMASKNLFKELTYYMETCYSGSMFEQTPNNLNIYAVSAANTHQSSYAAYCPPSEDVVSGTHLGTCLGDLFSINWMENTESADLNKETLQQQFQTVHDKTAPSSSSPWAVGSEVLQWGDVSFTNQSIGTFLGSGKKSASKSFLAKLSASLKQSFNNNNSKKFNPKAGAVASTEAHTNYLMQNYMRDPSTENFQALNHDLLTTQKFNEVFDKFTKQYAVLGKPATKGTDFTCYRFLINALINKCGYVNDASAPHFQKMYDFCAVVSTTNASYSNVQFQC